LFAEGKEKENQAGGMMMMMKDAIDIFKLVILHLTTHVHILPNFLS
jgi:hypothetical protein